MRSWWQVIVFTVLVAGFVSFIWAEIIDDCCCSMEVVEQANHDVLNPLLNSLITQPFFKYFKLNLYKECPFWVQNTMCGLSGGCEVCPCDENEVPLPWRVEYTDRVESIPSPQFERRWNNDKSLPTEDTAWTADGGPEDQLVYVNLEKYPESNTGYLDDASRVWRAIYHENCFPGEGGAQCLEKRVFYRLISGLHASISTHIAKFYRHKGTAGNIEWESEPSLFYDKVGKFPERVRNLYFTYLFLLRAVSRAAPLLAGFKFQSGDTAADEHTRRLVDQLLSAELVCQPTFNDAMMFRGGTGENTAVDTESLLKEFRARFRNVSEIMNCVGCEKCKVYGKMQVLGLATALKILLHDRDPLAARELTLQRNEIVALVNTLRQLSTSIEAVREFMGNSLQAETTRAVEVTLSTAHIAGFVAMVSAAIGLAGLVWWNTRRCKAPQTTASKKRK